MSSKSNNQGRAFEYACLMTLYTEIRAIRRVDLIEDESYQTSLRAYSKLEYDEQSVLFRSASSIVDTIFALEPNIIEKGDDILNLYIQKDNRGKIADVRDIIIERDSIRWEIGLSIKHNHMAVKHSRLSKVLDFGEKWYNIKCSPTYWNEVKDVFDFLEKGKQKKLYFRDIEDKEDRIYIPILKAFIKEITTQIKQNAAIPRRLLEYILSKYDFYKIISIDDKRVCTIQSFNIYGTLNRRSKTKEAKLKIPLMQLPKKLLYIDFRPNSKTTVLMCFDNGWQFSFRIHNAKDLIEPSLKFDINIVGMPQEVNVKFNCKW